MGNINFSIDRVREQWNISLFISCYKYSWAMGGHKAMQWMTTAHHGHCVLKEQRYRKCLGSISSNGCATNCYFLHGKCGYWVTSFLK